MKLSVFIFFVMASLFEMGISPSMAHEIVTFGPAETKMTGAIRHTVIGTYKAQFGAFKGRIVLDGTLVRSVYLEIDANSIRSNCPWCDRLARSRRLLYAARYPKIIFESDKIIQDEKGYKVEGVLIMHGIKRKMTFPFMARIDTDQETKRQWLDLKGDWIINRKDFNIVWSRALDRGGVLVGDDFTVDWGIEVNIKPFT